MEENKTVIDLPLNEDQKVDTEAVVIEPINGKEKHTSTKKRIRHKDRKGRICEQKRGVVCFACANEKLSDIPIERIHNKGCECYWCDLCSNEKLRLTAPKKIHLDSVSENIVNIEKRNLNIERFEKIADSISNYEENQKFEFFNYAGKQDFNRIYMFFLKYSKFTTRHFIKDIDLGTSVKKGIEGDLNLSEYCNLLFKPVMIAQIHKIWGIDVTTGSRNEDWDYFLYGCNVIALEKLSNKKELVSHLLENGKLVNIMLSWTDWKMLSEKDGTMIHFYKRIETVLFNKL